MTPSEYSRLTDGFDPIGMTPLEVRLAMIANGYNPTPLDGKRPLLNGWQNLVATGLLAQQWGNIGPNTSMLTRDTPVLDIDILDECAAQIVEATARLSLEDKGEILVRVGLPPKRAILLRTDKPFRKIIRKLTSPDEQSIRLKCLAQASNWPWPAFILIPRSRTFGRVENLRSTCRVSCCRLLMLMRCKRSGFVRRRA
jgi:hypothetical protein